MVKQGYAKYVDVPKKIVDRKEIGVQSPNITTEEPVLNNELELCWLIKTTKKIADANVLLKDAVRNKEPLEGIPVYELKPHALWQCNRCGAEAQSSSNKPDYCKACGRDATFKQVTKIINPDLWKIPKWEDIPVEDLDMLGLYNDTVDLLKKTLVFVEDIQYKTLTLWIFSTYKLENWNTVGFPFFVGLHDSGKTKGLDIIRELGWRMIPAANCKFVAMVRAAHVYKAGVLIDEVEYKLSPKTERGQEMLEFIKPGYRKGVKYCVGDKEDPLGIVSYNNFSFRGLAGENLYDRAMLSRCIPFEMEKDIPDIEDITKEQNEFDRIQTILLNYRYKTNDPPELPEDFELHGRIREIFESIIRTGMHIGLDTSDVVDFAKRYEKEQIAEFQNSVEREILDTIYTFETLETLDDAPEIIQFSNICEKMEWTEPDQKQRLGYIIRGKTMRLPSYRDKKGKILKLQDPKTRRKLNYLYKRYGVVSDE